MGLAVLVLHGPNLAALADEEIDARLSARASALGVSLTIEQRNGEEGLLDVLHAEAAKHDAVLVNPGVLAPTAVALAEGLAQVGLPTVEVLLTRPRVASALAGVAAKQVHGAGVDGYETALEHLANGVRTRGGGAGVKRAVTEKRLPARAGKTIGRRQPKAAERQTVVAKSLGPRTTDKHARLGVTRAQVRERIKERLRGATSPDALASWARETWAALQAGVAAEPGAEELLESVLLALMAPRTDDAGLISLMARLDQ